MDDARVTATETTAESTVETAVESTAETAAESAGSRDGRRPLAPARPPVRAADAGATERWVDALDPWSDPPQARTPAIPEFVTSESAPPAPTEPQRRLARRTLVVLGVAALFAGGVAAGIGVKLNDNREMDRERAALEEQVRDERAATDAQRDAFTAKAKEAADAQAKVAQLEQQLADTERRRNDTQAQLDAARLERDQARAQLTDLQKQFDDYRAANPPPLFPIR